ncbi:MAG: UMP kinase [Methanobacteriaceae archaeon]|nr:UMP kinase [Methanobacteriaceae archaeon]
MRIVITVGGSIIIKDHHYKRFQDYARVLQELAREHQIMVVVGGGKTARDYIGIARDLGASEAMCDDLGIEVTRLNARLLITALGEDAYPRVPHNFAEALEFSTSGRMVVMGGTEPAHSTDAVGSILAEFVDADILLNATSVDGLYDKDPHKHPDATMIPEITPREMLETLADSQMKAGTYEFLDKTAIQIIDRSNIKTVIFNGENPENLKKAIKGEIGTLIVPNQE